MAQYPQNCKENTMYQLALPITATANQPRCIIHKNNPLDRTELGSWIPFDLENSDFVKFVSEFKNGAELLDETGSVVPYNSTTAGQLGIAYP